MTTDFIKQYTEGIRFLGQKKLAPKNVQCITCIYVGIPDHMKCKHCHDTLRDPIPLCEMT